VIERALETTGLMLGSEKSRGYCLEMICADFLAGANLDGGNPEALVLSVGRLLAMLSPKQKQTVFGGEGVNIDQSPCKLRRKANRSCMPSP